MGHYVRGTRHVIPVISCPVHDERGNALAFRFRDAVAQANLTADAAAVKGIAVRVGMATSELMATLVLTREADRRVRTATRRVIEDSRPSSFHVNIHPRGDAYIFGRQTRRIFGSERLREQVGGASFLISPTAFFQTNVQAAAILVEEVRQAVSAPARVLDLYAGAGLFALPLARAGNDVLAIEESREAAADGETSRRLNGITEARCRFVARRVEDALPRLPPRAFDLVVLDPPRAGCTTPVVDDVFGRLSPPRAIYVSCNPEALAHDLRAIVRHRYDVESLQPVDMFPHTPHVETVAVLVRSRSQRSARFRQA